MPKHCIKPICAYVFEVLGPDTWVTRTEIVWYLNRSYRLGCTNMDVSNWLQQFSRGRSHTLHGRIRQHRTDKRATAPVFEYQLHLASSKLRAA